MTRIEGIPSRPDASTYKGAVVMAQRDFARLLYEHSPYWSVDMECKQLVWACSCDDVPRNAASMETHILNAVKKIRGPIRPPNTQTKRY